MEEFIIDLFYKLTVTLVVSLLISLIFKPIRKRLAHTRIAKFIMRKLGMEKYKVVVYGKIYPEPWGSSKELFSFEVELPLKDISDWAMPIEESNYLIIQAINKKYARNFDTDNYYINNVTPRKVIYYQRNKES